MFEPKNEQGVIVCFSQEVLNSEWKIVGIQTAYPDAQLTYKGEEWLGEFELFSSNFIDHKHNPKECDIVICWEHDCDDFPLPVISLKNEAWKIENFVKLDKKDLEIWYWRQRALRAEKCLRYQNKHGEDAVFLRRTPQHTVDRRMAVLRAIAKTAKRSDVNFTELGSQHGVSDTAIKKDVEWLVGSGHWVNGDVWKPTAKGIDWAGLEVSAN